MKKDYPCKDCAERKLGCHGSCQKYMAAKAEDMKITEEKRNEMNYIGYCVLRLERIARMRGKKLSESSRVIA